MMMTTDVGDTVRPLHAEMPHYDWNIKKDLIESYASYQVVITSVLLPPYEICLLSKDRKQRVGD